MTLILSPCRRCGGQVIENHDDPRCVQCSAPAIPPTPDLTPEKGNPSATVHRLRWTVRLQRMRPGRNSIPLEVVEIIIEYVIYESKHPAPPAAHVVWVSGCPPTWSTDYICRQIRRLFKQMTAMELRGLESALAETV